MSQDRLTPAQLAQIVGSIDFAQMAKRMIQDMIAQAIPDHWERAAAEWEAVGTPEAKERAIACRQHAYLLRMPEIDIEGLL